MTTYPPPSPPYLGPAAHTSAGDNKPIRRIVIHSTVSACEGGGARQIAGYFRNPNSGGSAHYVVDPGEEVQVVYDSKIAWHAPPNANSLGIEMCEYPNHDIKRWDEKNHAAMLERTARLVAALCLAYDVPARKVGRRGLKAGRKGICGHVDVSKAFGQSTHWDPGAFPWRRFIRLVRAEVDELTGKTARRKRKPRKPNRVAKAHDLLDDALDLLAATPKRRKVVHNVTEDLRHDVHRLPER